MYIDQWDVLKIIFNLFGFAGIVLVIGHIVAFFCNPPAVNFGKRRMLFCPACKKYFCCRHQLDDKEVRLEPVCCPNCREHNIRTNLSICKDKIELI